MIEIIDNNGEKLFSNDGVTYRSIKPAPYKGTPIKQAKWWLMFRWPTFSVKRFLKTTWQPIALLVALGLAIHSSIDKPNTYITYQEASIVPMSVFPKVIPTETEYEEISSTPKKKPSKKEKPIAAVKVEEKVNTPKLTYSKNKQKVTIDYINRYSEIAVIEMHKFGVPASISLAQAIIESTSGTSKLATNANNHFGIKCFSKSCSKGHCTNRADDHHKDFFVKYGNSWASWRDHSKKVTSGRYAKLKKHGKDYEAWAKGLKKAGYATDKNYAQTLIEIIELYELYKFDKL